MTISILAVSGSLRKKSTNSRLLSEMSKHVDAEISYTIFDQIEELPQFNPDKENNLASETSDWIRKVKKADVLVIATPEYAHGIPGSLKNALDWLVSTDAFIEKHFSIYSVCPRPLHCPQSLLEVLKTMSGIHLSEADITIDIARNFDTADIVLTKNASIETMLNSFNAIKTYLSNVENA